MNPIVPCCLAIALGLLVIIVARRHSDDWPLLWYGVAFIVLYFVDAALTSSSVGLSLSPSLRAVPFTTAAAGKCMLLASLTLLLALMVTISYRSISHRRPSEDGLTPDVSASPRKWVAFVPLVLALPFVVPLVVHGGLKAFLLDRQLYLNGSLLTLVAYYLAPVATALSFYCARSSRRPGTRAVFVVLTAVYAVLCFYSGSRTTALLGAVAPVLHYAVMARSRRRRSGRAGRVAFSLVAVGLVGLVAQHYASQYRGSGNTVSGTVFGSQDISQYDATVAVIDDDVRYRAAYSAAFVSLVPRSIWAGKPISGNAAASKSLYPTRYEQSKSEIAVSIVGESFLVLGSGGWIGGGLILGLWVAALNRTRLYYWRLGAGAEIFFYVYFYRGFNLIRGDLLDFIVPTVLTALFLRLALTRSGVSSYRRSFELERDNGSTQDRVADENSNILVGAVCGLGAASLR